MSEIFSRRRGLSFFAACWPVVGLGPRDRVAQNVCLPKVLGPERQGQAERAGQQNVRSTQHRLRGCLWQMRYPGIKAGSDASITLISFWTDAARGQPAILPDLKR